MTRHFSLFRTWAVTVVVVLCSTFVFGQNIPLKNWPVGKKLAISANADISNPGVFIAVNPCRVVDTRGATGAYGGPALVGGASRSFNIPAGPCTGIPTTANSFSLNFTVVNETGPNGFLTAYPTGTTRPTVSTLNYTTNTTIANAAIVPGNASGSIDVYVNVSTDALIDINGYYLDRTGTTNAGESLGVFGNISGSGVIVGSNATTVGSSWGVLGQITSTAPGGFSTGVRGINNGTGGNGIGVWGSQNGGGWGGYFTAASGIGVLASGGSGIGVEASGSIYGVYGSSSAATGIGVYGISSTYNGVWAQSGTWDAVAAFGGRDGGYFQGARNGAIGNSSGTTGVLSGLWGYSASTTSGATGVLGQANGTSGYLFGVKGTTASPNFDSAGVKGVAGTGDPVGDTLDCGPCLTAGVRGVSINSYGVMGMSRGWKAVGGLALAPTGTTVNAEGLLGYFDGTNYFGVFSNGNTGATGTKSFIEPHPTDANKIIRYVALEGPEAGTYFRGTAQISGGDAVIDVPESFRLVTEEEGMTVQLTPVGDLATMAVISQDLNHIIVRSSKDVKFHYMVNGVRHGYANYETIVSSNAFMPTKANAPMSPALNDAQKAALISNGTYNADGTVNLRTAERMGWTTMWKRQTEAQDVAKRAQQ